MRRTPITLAGLCLLAIFLSAGCAWQDISPLPEFTKAKRIPLQTGVVLIGDRSAVRNGRAIVKHLKDNRVFQSLAYPVKKGEKPEATLTLEVQGKWNIPENENSKRAFLVGLSFGLLRPYLGLRMTGDFKLAATLDIGGRTSGEYDIREQTEVRWSAGSDDLPVKYEAQDVELAWLAYDLAEEIREDWPRIAGEIGKPNPE